MDRRLAQVTLFLALAQSAALAQPARAIRCQSGPSGVVVDAGTFRIESPRSRFIFPNDKSLVIYCEFEGNPGRNVLTGVWKDPSGKSVFVSADVQLQTPGRAFSAYWTYYLSEEMPPGPWTLEIRVNGQVAGSHLFEVVTPAKAPEAPVIPPVDERKFPTLDELFTRQDALVWIRKRDPAGRVIDIATGFVIAKDQIATAFESIDGAASIDVETASGQKHNVNALVAWNRLQNWAILPVPTADMKPFDRATEAPKLGARVTVFNAEPNAIRTIGGVDFVGKNAAGSQWLLQPTAAMSAVGGPVLDSMGAVVGILASNETPGLRIGTVQALSIPRWRLLNSLSTVGIPISLVPAMSPAETKPTPLSEILAKGEITPPLASTSAPELQYATVSLDLPKTLTELGSSMREVNEVSKGSNSEVGVYSVWRRVQPKVVEGMLSMTVSHAGNSRAIVSDAVKIKLPAQGVTQQVYRFQPARLPPGVYRIDLLWNGDVVWRSGLRVSN
jgi:hypothetical protein